MYFLQPLDRWFYFGLSSVAKLNMNFLDSHFFLVIYFVIHAVPKVLLRAFSLILNYFKKLLQSFGVIIILST